MTRCVRTRTGVMQHGLSCDCTPDPFKFRDVTHDMRSESHCSLSVTIAKNRDSWECLAEMSRTCAGSTLSIEWGISGCLDQNEAFSSLLCSPAFEALDETLKSGTCHAFALWIFGQRKAGKDV